MGIFRSTDPTTFDDVDGIIVNESAPAPNIQGVAANIAILVGQFQRGPSTLTEVGSIGEFHEIYGKSNFQGNLELKNKRFGRLRLVRVTAAAAATATLTVDDGGGTPVDIIKFDAKQGKGAYGNNIKVTIAAGSSSGKKYTFQDTNPDAVLNAEVYDNIVITAVTSETFASSRLVSVTVLATSAEPENTAAAPLAAGSDGTVADTDYETALNEAAVEGAGNILFLDSYNTTRNGYLEAHAAATQDKMVILVGPSSQTVAAAITDVANYRDTEGRMIYAYPWVKTVIGSVEVLTSPASWYASVVSQTSPHVDPAYSANTQYLGGITGLALTLNRANYINLKDAGISAFELDTDIGFKIKSGIVTQIANSSKVTVLRRRMADYLTASAAKFLKNYQNAVNSSANRSAVKGAFLSFIAAQERDGILPSDAEVKDGVAKVVDVDSLNTDASIAAGFFKILWRQRIFSSMRYIVLQAEIGESVVVTEA
jgi:hypothetical protein